MRKLSENEAFQEERQKLKDLKGLKKVEYIWDYYKIPIIAIVAAALFVGSYIRTLVTEKDPVLFTTLIDMDYDDAFSEKLDTDFVSGYLGLNPKKQEVFVSSTTYLTEEDAGNTNYQYVMAMQARLLADTSARRMDVVLTDQKGFEGLAHEGYLLDLDSFLQEQDPDLLKEVEANLAKASVKISDNQDEVLLDSTVPYKEITEDWIVGIDVSDWNFFSDAEVSRPLYLGIVSNSRRLDTVLEYLHYMLGE